MSASSSASPPPRLLFVVTEDWVFPSHRLPMARGAKAAGFEVHVAAKMGDARAAIEAEGFHTHNISLDRGSLSPLGMLRTAYDVWRLIRKLQPEIVHNVAVKPILAGSLAALFSRGVSTVNSLAGRGTIFVDNGRTANIARPVVGKLLAWLLSRSFAWTIVQNPDDGTFLRELDVPEERMVLIAGSGVDTEALQPLPEPPPPVTACYAGRMVGIKGVPTLIEAISLLRKRGVAIRFLLAGDCDPGNPGSLAPEQLTEFAEALGFEWLGHVDDIRDVWGKAHIAVLASRGGEGVPKTLLDAAACGRAMVATDVPGSREICVDEKTGLQVPVSDPEALADAIGRLAQDGALRQRLAKNARALVEERFSAKAVSEATAALYRRVTGRSSGANGN